MKKIILFVSFLYCFICFSQIQKNFVLLNDFKNRYKPTQYTFSTKKMYGIDKEIKIYNLSMGNGKLLVISILPDLESDTDWEEISFKLIEEKIISIQDVEKNISKENRKKFFNTFEMVKKENNRYYVAKNSLVEMFKVISSDESLNLRISGENIINLSQKIRTYQDVKKAYKSLYNTTDFPMEYAYGSSVTYISDELKAIYLSEIEQDNEKIYHFWTFDDWHIARGYNYHRGIDRFVYVKEKGIVAGSYDFYFDKTPEDFKRVVRYDVMWAKELFPEKQ